MNEDQQPKDVVGITMAEESLIQLDTHFLGTNVRGDHSAGIRIHEWGDEVVLMTGVDDDDGEVFIGQRLSPEQARDVAETLQEAADLAEQAPEHDRGSSDDRSLRDLLSL